MTLSDVNRNVVAAFFSIAVFAPLLWMLLDRDQPYERTSGEMVPAEPEPGAFVNVSWRIKVYRICSPSTARNVTRTVIDSKGVYHDYEPVDGVYGTDPTPPPGIIRGFQLPAAIPPGPARYHSVACFVCNPIQALWPDKLAVCVGTPDIAFNILEPTK